MTFWTGLTFAFNVAASTSQWVHIRIEIPISRFQEPERKSLRKIHGINMNQHESTYHVTQIAMYGSRGMEACPADEAGKEQGANPHRHGNSNRNDRSRGAGARERDSIRFLCGHVSQCKQLRQLVLRSDWETPELVMMVAPERCGRVPIRARSRMRHRRIT